MVVAACGSSTTVTSAPDEGVDTAAEQWQDAATHYRFVVERVCCPTGRAAVEVADGAVVAFEPVSGDTSGLDRTIEDWFAVIDTGADLVATFDDELGHPVTLEGDEIGSVRFGSVVVLDGGALSGPDAPAGIHECALLTRGEVDGFFGAAVEVGTYHAPLVQVATCRWDVGDESLVLTLFAGSDAFETAVADGSEVDGLPGPGRGTVTADGATLAVDLDSVVLVFEFRGRSSDATLEGLIELIRAAAPRVPGR